MALFQVPELSYLIAWLGSFFIFYSTLFSSVRFLSAELPIHQQVMRPIVLIQLVFAGYMCCSSIFYFMDHQGFHFFSMKNEHIFYPEEQIYLIAKCQRICLLAHAALVTGIIISTKRTIRPKYKCSITESQLLTRTCLTSYALAFLLSGVQGTLQFALMLFNLGLFSGALLLVRGIKNKSPENILMGASVFLANLSIHIFSGYKEIIISHLIIFASLSYPFYRKTTQILVVPFAISLFVLLPSFTKNIRKIAWANEGRLSEIQKIDYLNVLEDTSFEEIENDNWDFLTNRLSEIGMFTGYVGKVPESRDYYGLDILENSIQALIPRILWNDKPNTEKISMERVYELGIVNQASNVSAKSRPVVDGYLSGGLSGVFILMLLYGYAAQSICNMAESWFGGYSFGCTIVFNSLFQQLWRGNNLEFLLNNLVYGTLLMLLIFRTMKLAHILIPEPHAHPHHSIL